MAPTWAGPGLFYSPKDNTLGSWPDPLRRCEMESAHRKSEWKSHESIPHDQKKTSKLGWKAKLDLYKSMIVPIITYVSPLFGLSKYTITQIEKVQKRISYGWL